ncbi:MAG: aspartate ammonia-lyase, partial [Verrucomicrobiales bacterium]|nr:aspartate ammonia-lyase [Verrucomicrobiales bacterium]
RTHYQDATPIRLGQEFSGYAAQIEFHEGQLKKTMDELSSLALGGTAVGTGLNTSQNFVEKTIDGINLETGMQFHKTGNHFAAQGAQDAAICASAALKCLATALIKIANDIRYLGSGPRLGIGELVLPALQPGSSIMPGKVNPVMPEMLIQVAVQVMANDNAVSMAGSMGHLELNTMLPVIIRNLLQSLRLLAHAIDAFTHKCLAGLVADEKVCAESVEQSLSMATVLAPVIGYEKAAAIAKEAFSTQKTIREVSEAKSGLDPEELRRLLEAKNQV